MGNCLTCFKEPQSSAQDSITSNYNKEEMPEAPLYPAPSHALLAPTLVTTTTETAVISNGNHLVISPCAQETTITLTVAAAAATTTTPTTNNSGSGGVGGAINIFSQCQKRICSSKSSSTGSGAMGGVDSKQQPSDSKLNALFDVYKDETEDAILADGIEDLCRDLQVSPDEFKVLLFAWKLNAEQMCRFTRTEFVNGLRAMRVDTIKGIQHRLPELVHEVTVNTEQFKSLYRFTFKFGLDVVTGQRILPTEMAILLWRLVFTVREPPILARWLRFLETHQMIRGIPRDTWNMFLNFSEAVGDDLSSYDDTEAWPSLFDDFVEYENDQANQNITKEKECEGLLIKQDN